MLSKKRKIIKIIINSLIFSMLLSGFFLFLIYGIKSDYVDNRNINEVSKVDLSKELIT